MHAVVSLQEVKDFMLGMIGAPKPHTLGQSRGGQTCFNA
jgi:hypothetical protein